MKQPDWTKANCQGTDTDSFYPEVGSSIGYTALRVCESCDIIEDCREYAIKHEKHGVWGGMLPVARKEYRRRHGISLETPDLFIDNASVGVGS
jgi:WhiB family redox-sensing transcriptional regulator